MKNRFLVMILVIFTILYLLILGLYFLSVAIKLLEQGNLAPGLVWLFYSEVMMALIGYVYANYLLSLYRSKPPATH